MSTPTTYTATTASTNTISTNTISIGDVIQAPTNDTVTSPTQPLGDLLETGYAAVDNSGSTGGLRRPIAETFVNASGVGWVSLWNSYCAPAIPRSSVQWRSTGGTQPHTVFHPTNHVPANASCFIFMTDGEIYSTAELARHANATAHLPSLLVLFRSPRQNERVSTYNVSVLMAHFTAAQTAAVVILNEQHPSAVRLVAVKGDWVDALPPAPTVDNNLLVEECPRITMDVLHQLPSRTLAPQVPGTIPLQSGRALNLNRLLVYPSFDVVSMLSPSELEDVARAFLTRGQLPAWRARLNNWLVQINAQTTTTRTETSGLHAMIRRLQLAESEAERRELSASIQQIIREGTRVAQEAEAQARRVARSPRAMINAALAAVTALETTGMNATSLGRLANRAARADTVSRSQLPTLADLNTTGAPHEEDLVLYEVGPNALVLRAMEDVEQNTSDAALNEPLRVGQFRENTVFEPLLVSLEMADQIEQLDASPLTRQRLSVCLPMVSLADANNRQAVFQRLCVVFMNGRSMQHVWLIALSSVLRALETEEWADPESTAAGRVLQWFASEIMTHVTLAAGTRLSPNTRQPVNEALAALLQDDILTVHSSIQEASVILRLLQRFGASAVFSNDDLRRSMLARLAAAIPQLHRNWLQENADDLWRDQGPRSVAALMSSLYETRVDASGAHVPVSGTGHLVERLDTLLPLFALEAVASFARSIGQSLDDMVTPGLTVVVVATLERVTSPHVSSTAAVQLARSASNAAASEMSPLTVGIVTAEEAMDAVRLRLAWARTPLHPLSPFTTPFGPSVFWFYAPDGTVFNMAEGFQVFEDEVQEDPSMQLVRLTEYVRENRGRLMARFYGTHESGAFAAQTTAMPMYREMADEFQSTNSNIDLTGNAEEVSGFVHRVVQRIVGRSGLSAGNTHGENLERDSALLLPSLVGSSRQFPGLASNEPCPVPLIRRVGLELGNRRPDALGEPPNPVWVPLDDPELLETLIRVQQDQGRARAAALRRRLNRAVPSPASTIAALPRGIPGRNMGRFQRSLTWYLRHGAPSTRPDGYVDVEVVLDALAENRGRATIDQLLEVAETDAKGRYSVMEEDGILYIRATQGHTIASVDPEQLMTPILRPEDVPVCLHGTYEENFRTICRTGGLNRMQRQMIQMAIGLPDNPEVQSGIRSNVELVIYIDVERAMRVHGLQFYRSANNVICSAGPIPLDCFISAIRLRDGNPVEITVPAPVGNVVARAAATHTANGTGDAGAEGEDDFVLL